MLLFLSLCITILVIINGSAKSEYYDRLSQMSIDAVDSPSPITVELIDACIHKLKLGKALGGGRSWQ